MRASLVALSLATTAALPKCEGCHHEKPIAETSVLAVRSPARLSFTVLDDGTLVIDANVHVYELTNDDTIVRVGNLATYEPLLPTMDDPSNSFRLFVPRSLHGTRSALEARTFKTTFFFDGRTWQRRPTTEPPAIDAWADTRFIEAARLVPRIEPPKDVELPNGFHSDAWVRGPNDLAIAFGTSKDRFGEPVTMLVPRGERVAREVRFEDGATSLWNCNPVPSADGKPYASCAIPDVGSERERRLFRLEDGRWKLAPIPLRGSAWMPITIARDGSVWTTRLDPPRILRAHNGRVDEVMLDAIAMKVGAATYSQRAPSEPRYDDAEGFVRADLGSPKTLATGEIALVRALVARPSGRVFALVTEKSGDTRVYRFGSGASPPPPRTIGSEPDQLVEILDEARETQRWVGHCKHVFVELHDAKTSRDARDRAAQGAAIWTAIEGRIKTRRVFGLVGVPLSGPTEAEFEQKVSELVERHTTNPASPPPVTCTLPVLDRLL